MRILVIVLGAIEFFGTLDASDGVSHICHLGGMLVGYIYIRRGGRHVWLEELRFGLEEEEAEEEV